MSAPANAPGGLSTDMHVGRENLHWRAYAVLRKALMTGRFQPGQRLLLRPLAQELGISVTPIREALFQLVSEHALVADSSRSLMVPVLSLARFREIRDLRIELEGRAAEAAARHAAPADVAILQDMHGAMLRCRLDRESHGALANNEAFHFKVYELAGMPILYSLIEGLWVRIGPVLTRLYDHIQPGSTQPHPHESIIAALARRDGGAARLAVASDIMWASSLLERTVETLAGSGALKAAPAEGLVGWRNRSPASRRVS